MDWLKFLWNILASFWYRPKDDVDQEYMLSETVQVLPSGYCVPTGFRGWTWYRAVQKALAGIQPGYYDNSAFARVDSKYSGQLMTECYTDFKHEVPPVLFDNTGAKVPILSYDTLFGYTKWGKDIDSYKPKEF